MFRLKFAAYWGDRPESPEACAGRLAACLETLGATHPLLASWFHQARSRKAANRAVDTSLPALTQMMLAGRNRHEVDRAVIPELGYQVGMWNGSDEVGANLLVGCGLYSPWVLNDVTLTMPLLEAASAALYDPPVLRRILAALVDAWEPDWAVCTTNELRTAQAPAPRTPVVGWLTYLGPTRPVPAVLDTGVVDALGSGHLIMLGEAPEALTAEMVNLARAGLLRAGALAATP